MKIRKITAVILAAVLAAALSACSAGEFGVSSTGAASSQAASSAPASAGAGQYEDSLAGLQKYLVAGASVSGSPDAMRADIIGAKSGVRYKYGYNGKDNVTLELYEFDPARLNATARRILSEVRSGGSFTLMDEKVDAVLSDSGKYLMVFRDSSSDEKNKAYAENVKKLFRSFPPTA